MEHIKTALKSMSRSRQPFAIQLKFTSGQKAIIFFTKGELVHAEFQDLIGDEAFAETLVASNGTYQIIRGLAADVVSIEQDAHQLIADCNQALIKGEEENQIDATQTLKQIAGRETTKKNAAGAEVDVAETVIESKDIERAEVTESAGGRSVTGDAGVTKVTGVTGGGWTPPPPPEKGFQEELWLIDWARDTPGFHSAWIVKNDGTEVSSVGAKDRPKITTGVAQIIAGMHCIITKTGPARVKIECDANYLYISSLKEGYYLVVEIKKAEAQNTEERLNALVAALNDFLDKA